MTDQVANNGVAAPIAVPDEKAGNKPGESNKPAAPIAVPDPKAGNKPGESSKPAKEIAKPDVRETAREAWLGR